MTPRGSGAREGLALAAVLAGIAVAFALLQWRERRTRGVTLSAEDRQHFRRKDVRRLIGSAVMLAIAVGVAVGSWIDVRVAGRTARRVFGWTWLGVVGLLAPLLVLALFDWAANREYGRRHRRLLAEERRAVIREELRRRAAPGNGRAGPDPIGERPGH